MNMCGSPLGSYLTECPYIRGNRFLSENILINDLDPEGLDYLLSIGFRHFGRHFFRPVCEKCHQCIPIRVPVEGCVLSRNLGRIVSKGRDLRCEVSAPAATKEKYQLYLSHTARFEQRDTAGYESFEESFFHALPFSRELRIYRADELIAVSHFDITGTSLSAVYCYWDERAAKYSPGSYAILKELEIARTYNLSYLYLGYYVPENRHMNYKSRFRPNEVLLNEAGWEPFISRDGKMPDTSMEGRGFIPSVVLRWE